MSQTTEYILNKIFTVLKMNVSVFETKKLQQLQGECAGNNLSLILSYFIASKPQLWSSVKCKTDVPQLSERIV